MEDNGEVKEQIIAIEVDFNNKNFHKNLSLADLYGFKMATLNYSGVFLASKGQIENLDAYEEDDDDQEDDLSIDGGFKRKKVDKKKSNLVFRSFDSEPVEWHYELKKGEITECVAAGTNWVCVYTSSALIRVFTSSGIQKFVISQGSPVLTMSGYENLL